MTCLISSEYITHSKLTCASDIYSFGVVVLQLLSGRKVIELDIVPRDSLTKKVNSGIYFSESYPCYTEQELGKSISEVILTIGCSYYLDLQSRN